MSNLALTYQGFIRRISETAKKDILFKLSRFTLVILSTFIISALVLISFEAIFEFNSFVRKVF